MARRAAHFVIRHWQGRVALLPTLLVSLLGLRLALSSLGRLKPESWPLLPFAAVSLTSAAVLVWQVMGSLRAVRRDGSGPALAAGATAITIAAALFITSEFDGYAARSADSGGMPPVHPLPVDDRTMRLTGPLDWPLYARFCVTLQAHPGLEAVALESDGGYVPVARAMAARIIEAGLDTTVTGLCASACTLVFMAGEGRSLAPGGALGFHGYTLRRNDPLQNVAEEEARDRAWLRARGVDDDFINQAFETAPGQIWRPDTRSLHAAGVLRPAAGAPVDSAPLPADCGGGAGQAASP